MGWSNYYRPTKGQHGHETNVEHFRVADGNEVIAHATVNGTYYAAVREKGGTVTCMVILTRWTRGDFNFWYKDLHESGLPVAEAPAHVLDALTPTTHASSLEWRRRCRERLAQREALRGLKGGDLVELNRALRFTDGTERKDFVIARRPVLGGRRTRAVLVGGGVTCRISGWQNMVVAVTRDGRREETPLAARIAERAANADVPQLVGSAS